MLALRRFFATLVIFLVLATRADQRQQSADCEILLDVGSSWPDFPPILTSSLGEFVYPEGSEDDRVITLQMGETIEMSCAGTQFDTSDLAGVEFASATCESNSDFSVSSTSDPEAGTFFFGDLGCQVQPKDESTEEDTTSCGPDEDGKEIRLGFRTERGFATTLIVCFQQEVSKSFYAVHVLPRQNIARDHSNDRPSFKSDGYYPFDVNEYYTRSQQQETIAELVGSEALAEEYVDDTSNVYLVRGHLSPNSDFVYYAHQDSTYYFINVMPQWQVFNSGHWLDIENGIRTFVEYQGRDLLVYTGTHGVMELKDINGVNVEIYLYPEENRLPVPRYFWKVLYDQSDETAIAIVGVNNPHLSEEEIDSDYRVCQDEITDHPIFLEIDDPDDISKGVVYACFYQELADQFPEVPYLGDPGLLI